MRMIRLSKRKHSKDVLAKMSALQITFGTIFVASKKTALILRVGQTDYAKVMNVTCTVITTTKVRATTRAEPIDTIQKQ